VLAVSPTATRQQASNVKGSGTRNMMVLQQSSIKETIPHVCFSVGHCHGKSEPAEGRW